MYAPTPNFMYTHAHKHDTEPLCRSNPFGNSRFAFDLFIIDGTSNGIAEQYSCSAFLHETHSPQDAVVPDLPTGMKQTDDGVCLCFRQLIACVALQCSAPHSVCTHTATHLNVCVHFGLVTVIEDVLEATPIVDMGGHPTECCAHVLDGSLACTSREA